MTLVYVSTWGSEFLISWAVRQLIGRYFSENIPGVASFALAVGSSADWLGHEASSKSEHMKALPITCRTAQYSERVGTLRTDKLIWTIHLIYAIARGTGKLSVKC